MYYDEKFSKTKNYHCLNDNFQDNLDSSRSPLLCRSVFVVGEVDPKDTVPNSAKYFHAIHDTSRIQ